MNKEIIFYKMKPRQRLFQYKLKTGPRIFCSKFKLVFMMVLTLSLFVLMLNSASANFACGEILNAGDGMEASWLDVRVFYPDNFSRYTTCEVSPSGNKYCCDTEAIIGKTWRVGYTMGAEIFDEKYVAGPVQMVSSAEGYDVFPAMQLKKVISIENFSKVNVGDDRNFSVGGRVLAEYGNVSYSFLGEEGVLCEGCENFSGEFRGESGTNELKIFASGKVGGLERKFEENLRVAFIDWADLRRDFVCENCKDLKVSEGDIVNVTLRMNLSSEVFGMDFIEYVPIDWEIIDAGGGRLLQYSESHNKIIWNVSGREIERRYTVKAPGVSFLPVSYIFLGSLEDYFFEEQDVLVQGFWPFFSEQEEINSTLVFYKTYPLVSPTRPLVVAFKPLHLRRLAIYPRYDMRNVIFSIRNYSDYNNPDTFDYYRLEGSFNSSDIDKMIIEFSISKSYLNNRGYVNVSVYSISEDKIYPAEIYSETDNNYFYRVTIFGTEGFVFVGIKKELGFFEAIWDAIAFWE